MNALALPQRFVRWLVLFTVVCGLAAAMYSASLSTDSNSNGTHPTSFEQQKFAGPDEDIGGG
ncbi:MAG: hypothetical protein R3A44_06175 [Caldilineaceae bacterium]